MYSFSIIAPDPAGGKKVASFCGLWAILGEGCVIYEGAAGKIRRVGVDGARLPLHPAAARVAQGLLSADLREGGYGFVLTSKCLSSRYVLEKLDARPGESKWTSYDLVTGQRFRFDVGDYSTSMVNGEYAVLLARCERDWSASTLKLVRLDTGACYFAVKSEPFSFGYTILGEGYIAQRRTLITW